MTEEKKTKVSKAQQHAVNKYVANNYDRINVTFPKGYRDTLKECADSVGISVNALIQQAVYDRVSSIQKDAGVLKTNEAAENKDM